MRRLRHLSRDAWTSIVEGVGVVLVSVGVGVWVDPGAGLMVAGAALIAAGVLAGGDS